MKHFYLLFLLTSTFAFSQIPANYYDTATGTGYTLKTQLKVITTNGHIARTYDQLYDGDGITGSNGYEDTHTDEMVPTGNNYESDGTILDMYSEKPTEADSYNFMHGTNQCGNQSMEGDCYNREHLVPQSSFGSAFPMQSDIHHVIPTDGRVNNFRGSLPFGNVVDPNPDFTSTNGSKRGPSDTNGYSGTMFEPIDEFKGDIARALLYFATRYEDTVVGYSSFDMFNETKDEVFFPWAITVLLDWHNNVDPVDERERLRNEQAYNFQGNANPFVDHPEFANMIWNPMPDTQAPTVPTNLLASNPSTSTIDLSWTASTDDTAVTAYDIYVDGSFYVTTNSASTTFTVTGLTPDTTYTFTILAKDGSGNSSAQSAPENGTTQAGSTSTNELFFSEYVEGSSFNKALEIANFTGASVNLSGYSVRRDGNGGGSWDTGINLTGSIADGDVYVIANASIASSCASGSTIDTTVPQSNSPTNFNGNDPIGLFKDGTLIDIIGVFGAGSSDFAANTTLIRKPTVAGPNTVFDINNEWDMFPSNTCDNLGTHNQALSINNNSLTNLRVFPNPAISNKIEILYNDKIQLEIFDILGKKIKSFSLTSNRKIVDISTLRKGIYLLKLNSESGTVTKKLIRQ